MWQFNWGMFWALIAYGFLKFAVKRVLGLYSVQTAQMASNSTSESEEAKQRKYRLESMTGPPLNKP
jgi:hypothetical protein